LTIFGKDTDFIRENDFSCPLCFMIFDGIKLVLVSYQRQMDQTCGLWNADSLFHATNRFLDAVGDGLIINHSLYM